MYILLVDKKILHVYSIIMPSSLTLISEDLFKALYPSYIFQKLIGVAPFIIHGSKGNRYILNKVSKESKCYYMIPFVLLMISTIAEYYAQKTKLIFEETNIVRILISEYHSLLLVILLVTAIVSHRFYQRNLINICKDITDIDKQILSCFGIKIGASLIRVFSYVWVFLNTIVLCSNGFSDDLNRYLFFVTMIYKLAFGIGIRSWMHLIAMRFYIFRKIILNAEEPTAKKKLHAIIDLYLKLCNIIREIQKTYSLSVLTDILFDFAGTILQFYYFFVMFYDYSVVFNSSLIIAVIFTLLTIINLISIAFLSSNVIQQVCNRLYYREQLKGNDIY